MALHVWMPWVLTVGFLSVNVAIGNRSRRAFLVAFVLNLAGMYYNFATDQHGLVLGSSIAAFIALRNYAKWKERGQMLVVRVSVWPGGAYDREQEVARIGMSNRSGLAEFSNYDLVALLDRDRDERVIRSEVNQHERAQGWVPLVRRALTEIHLSEPGIHGVAYDDPTAVLLRKGSHVAGGVHH